MNFYELFLVAITIVVAYFAARTITRYAIPYNQKLLKHPDKLPRWPEKGRFNQECVGESNYQRALNELWDAAQEGPIDAALVYENNNRFDDKAVAVFIQMQLVGYLSRADARKYRRLCTKNNMAPVSLCKAKIFSREGKKGMKGVWLDI